MINLGLVFKDLANALPATEEVVSFSVYPLPYDGYFEIYVECKSKKRYRALATKEKIKSNYTEWKMMTPQQGK